MGQDRDEKVASVASFAEECFWTLVADKYPEIKSGDLSPEASEAFSDACLDAVSEWVRQNTPVPSASCELVVEMRPPRRGEIGYHARAETIEGALREVIAALPEGELWQADKDWMPDPDERSIVTVTTRPAIQGVAELKPPIALPMTREGREWAEFVASLPEHNGWHATWEYPGFIAWNHEDFRPMTVVATADWDGDEEIVFDVQVSNTGERARIGGKEWDLILAWPRAGRSPESYMALVGPRLDAIVEASATCGDSGAQNPCADPCPHCSCVGHFPCCWCGGD